MLAYVIATPRRVCRYAERYDVDVGYAGIDMPRLRDDIMAYIRQYYAHMSRR